MFGMGPKSAPIISVETMSSPYADTIIDNKSTDIVWLFRGESASEDGKVFIRSDSLCFGYAVGALFIPTRVWLRRLRE